MNRLLLLLCIVLAATANAAEIVPPEPQEFQTVNLRIETDSCAFVPSTVRVAHESGVIRVTQQMNACLLPGEARITDIRLGAFPMGEYAVEVYGGRDTDAGPPLHRLTFRVVGRVEIAVFPPPTRPLTDHSGAWWNPNESGWGLFLYQSPLTNIMLGAWFVYGPDARPEWYTLQGGRWTTSTTWTATVYRTSGPYLGRLPFDAGSVTIIPVGSATVDFTQTPGTVGRARFQYEVSGVGAATKTIQRLAF